MKTQLKTKRRMKTKSATIGLDKSIKNSGQRSSRIETAKSALSQCAEHGKKNNVPITAQEADRRFDEGEDVESLGFDLSKAHRPGKEIKRITIDLPAPFLERLDHWAAVRGMTRQALVKSWLFDRLKGESL